MTFGKIPMFMRGGIYDKPDNYMPDVQILKFANKSDNPNPEYAHSGDSGFDLRAYITESDENAKLDKKEGKYILYKICFPASYVLFSPKKHILSTFNLLNIL